MREIDRRTHVRRRTFLQASATVVPAVATAAAGIGISAQAAWAQEAKNLKPHTLATLVQVGRDTYPHDRIADLYYVKAIAPYDEAAGKDPAVLALLEEGVARLDGDAQNRYGSTYLSVPWESDRVVLLRGIELTPFHKKIRGDMLVTFYNQKDLWAKFGYEGASADKGGYIHRGFNDIDWLQTS